MYQLSPDDIMSDLSQVKKAMSFCVKNKFAYHAVRVSH